jgi:electron transfer flavoprotein alpha subunit
MRTLVVMETENGQMADATLRVIAAAAQRGLPIDLLAQEPGMVDSATRITGVDRVLVMPLDANSSVPETLAARLSVMADDYSLVAAAHRTLGRSVLPRAAALTGGSFLSDIIAVLGASQFVRGLYAGSIASTVTTRAKTSFATFRASSYPSARLGDHAASTVELPPMAGFAKTRLVERHAAERSGHDLASAPIVISGGRGLGSQENMERLGRFAAQIGAALGASRAAVDAGYISNAAQVGQTGKTVAPDVYFAVGISGAIQHLAGMKDSKTIVAINRDPDASIFSVADIGIVGDLFEVLGELETHVGTARTV